MCSNTQEYWGKNSILAILKQGFQAYVTIYRYTIPINMYTNHLQQENVTYVILPEHNYILACMKKRNKSLLADNFSSFWTIRLLHITILALILSVFEVKCNLQCFVWCVQNDTKYQSLYTVINTNQEFEDLCSMFPKYCCQIIYEDILGK